MARLLRTSTRTSMHAACMLAESKPAARGAAPVHGRGVADAVDDLGRQVLLRAHKRVGAPLRHRHQRHLLRRKLLRPGDRLGSGSGRKRTRDVSASPSAHPALAIAKAHRAGACPGSAGAAGHPRFRNQPPCQRLPASGRPGGSALAGSHETPALCDPAASLPAPLARPSPHASDAQQPRPHRKPRHPARRARARRRTCAVGREAAGFPAFSGRLGQQLVPSGGSARPSAAPSAMAAEGCAADAVAFWPFACSSAGLPSVPSSAACQSPGCPRSASDVLPARPCPLMLLGRSVSPTHRCYQPCPCRHQHTTPSHAPSNILRVCRWQ